jgi:hypothetical protein
MNPQSNGDRPADEEHQLAPNGRAYRIRYHLMIVLAFCGMHCECEAEQWF